FYIGDFYLKQGNYAQSRLAFQKNHQINGELLKIDPENLDWIMERSYSHNNLAAVQLESGMGVNQESLAHMSEAIALIEKAMQLAPVDTAYSSHYANTLAWAADAQLDACNLEDAMALRKKVRQLAESLSRSDPGDNDLKRRYAYAVSGMATIQTRTGGLDQAEQNLRLTISILEQMSAADPSNVLYPLEIYHRQLRLAKLMGGMGRFDEAYALMSELESKIGADSGFAEQNEENRQTCVDFQLSFARVSTHLGKTAEATAQLQKALDLQLTGSEHRKQGTSDHVMLKEMRFLWWEIHGDDSLADFPAGSEPESVTTGALRSCEDAQATAKEFVIAGDLEQAVRQVAYLQDRGYAEPAFIQFCTAYDLCAGKRDPL
ncbi:MAG: hypothetical protein WBN06_12245, partial [Lysobacterales bacterium]